MKFYRIYIPSEYVSRNSLYWKHAKFRFDGQLIETTHTEQAKTPRIAATKYIYSLPQERTPHRVYAENLRDKNDNGTFDGWKLREEIVDKVTRGGLQLLKRNW